MIHLPIIHFNQITRLQLRTRTRWNNSISMSYWRMSTQILQSNVRMANRELMMTRSRWLGSCSHLNKLNSSTRRRCLYNLNQTRYKLVNYQIHQWRILRRTLCLSSHLLNSGLWNSSKEHRHNDVVSSGSRLSSKQFSVLKSHQALAQNHSIKCKAIGANPRFRHLGHQTRQIRSWMLKSSWPQHQSRHWRGVPNFLTNTA